MQSSTRGQRFMSQRLTGLYLPNCCRSQLVVTRIRFGECCSLTHCEHCFANGIQTAAHSSLQVRGAPSEHIWPLPPQHMSFTSPAMSASMCAQPSSPSGGCVASPMADSGFS